MTPTELLNQPDVRGHLDDDFIMRALDEADLNALRVALFQATGDAELAGMELERVPVRGGASVSVILAEPERNLLKAKALKFLKNGAAGFKEKVPSDEKLRELMELLTGEPVSQEQFAYRRDVAAFEEVPRAVSWTGNKPQLPDGFQVAIIGAGISGIAMGIQLERLGIPYVIYERRSDMGGTWAINTYPDARVDTTNFLYQFSFEKKFPWTEYFARGGEVKGYLTHIAKKYGVYDHILFERDVNVAAFNEVDCVWDLQITGPGGLSQAKRFNVVVSATGLFSNPRPLDVPGVEDFAGPVVHTAEWPGDEIIRNRAVALIGNGSTGVQSLSVVSEMAERVHVFQRTPQWISPREKYGEAITEETQWLLQTMPYYSNWYIYGMLVTTLLGQRLQEPDLEWQAAGGAFNEPNDRYREMLVEYIQNQLEGHSDIAERVTPAYPPMARRMIVDNGWYKALLKDNVHLVTEGIERITPTGIVTADGNELPVDVIIAATGFSVSKFLWPTEFRGEGGERIHDRWNNGDGARAYLSITVPKFPNLFIMYGPNSQPRAGSIISWMEIWAGYVAQSLVFMIEHGHRKMVVREEICAEYNRSVDERAARLIWHDPASKDRNYLINAHGRQDVSAPWPVDEYYNFLAKVNPVDFEFS